MWAIEITDDTMPQILETYGLPDKNKDGLKLFNDAVATFYFFTGFITERGAVQPWAILPEHRVACNYEYDPDKIRTEFVQIFRL